VPGETVGSVGLEHDVGGGVVGVDVERVAPVQVTRATLAPGYVGMYLVEIEVPNIVNYGPAELYIETDGQPSNRVRVYIEP